jgi:hypothetical protein
MSRQKTSHQKFVQTAKNILTKRLAYADSYPVGSWMSRYTRPDLFIVQRSCFGKQLSKRGKESWVGTYDRFFIIECKVSLRDLPNAIFQLLVALVSIRSMEDLDFHHGGLAPVLAVPLRLKQLANKQGLLKELEDSLRELNFGFVVLNDRTKSAEWILPPSSL